jgi:hypothetical protein
MGHKGTHASHKSPAPLYDHPMTSVVPFERGHADQVVALWRMLHPDWTWLDDPTAAADLFEPSERIRYVVERGDAVIATAFASLKQDPTWTRNRIIDVQARPEDISADWLDIILGSLVAADRGQPDTWHVVNAAPCLSPVLGPLLETEGFVRSFKVWRIEWSGASVSPEHDHCGEVTVYEQVRDAPEGDAAEARVTRDPRDTIDRQLVIDPPIRTGRRGIRRPAADDREEECEKNQHNREISQSRNCRP